MKGRGPAGAAYLATAHIRQNLVPALAGQSSRPVSSPGGRPIEARPAQRTSGTPNPAGSGKRRKAMWVALSLNMPALAGWGEVEQPFKGGEEQGWRSAWPSRTCLATAPAKRLSLQGDRKRKCWAYPRENRLDSAPANQPATGEGSRQWESLVRC